MIVEKFNGVIGFRSKHTKGSEFYFSFQLDNTYQAQSQTDEALSQIRNTPAVPLINNEIELRAKKNITEQL